MSTIVSQMRTKDKQYVCKQFISHLRNANWHNRHGISWTPNCHSDKFWDYCSEAFPHWGKNCDGYYRMKAYYTVTKLVKIWLSLQNSLIFYTKISTHDIFGNSSPKWKLDTIEIIKMTYRKNIIFYVIILFYLANQQSQ